MPVLIFKNSPRRGERMVFERALLIGRGPLADLRLDDPSVSRRHALLSAERGRCFLSDLQSGNGTYLNAARVETPVEVRTGDEIRVGKIVLEFRLADGADPTASAVARVAIAEDRHRASFSASRSIVLPKAARPASTGRSELTAELARLEQRLRFLSNVGRETALTLETGERLGKILEHLLEILPQADRAFIVRIDPESEEFLPLAARTRSGSRAEIAASRTLLEEVLRRREALLSADVGSEDQYADSKSVHALHLRAVACVPLQVEDRILGILQVDNSERGRRLETADLELLVGAAGPIALALANSDLQRELVEREVLEHDLALARKIQLQFLPRKLAGIPGYSLAVEYSPALAVGGDLYDLLPLGPDRWLFAVGDVSGKGVSGALLMARLLSELRSAAPGATGAVELLERLNGFVEKESTEGMFVTMVLGLLQPSSGRLELASAGHLKPILRRADGRCGELAIDPSTALGLRKPLGARAFGLELRPGDLLAFYSDGLSEASSRGGERFGTARIVSAIRSAGEAEEALARVLESVRAFLAGAPFEDDLTVFFLSRSAAARA